MPTSLRPLFSLLACLLLALSAPAQVTFDSSFEAGNARNFQQTGPDAYSFRLERDTNSNDAQWYAFDVLGAQGRTLTLTLLGTDNTNVPNHWRQSRPVASTDGGATWAHVSGDTSRTDDTYTFTHAFTASPERIAFHFPYTHTTLQRRVAEWSAHPHVTTQVIGQSVQGRDIHLLRITNPDAAPAAGKHVFWIVARQHAAEVTGSYLLDGFMELLLSDDPTGRTLRDNADIWVAPMLNPDGVVAGNYRDNAAGVNLNRAWNDPSPETSPEILAITRRIDEWMAAGNRIDWFADLHSTAQVLPHFTFHADEYIEPPLYPTPETYGADTTRFLELLEAEDPKFDSAYGGSDSLDRRLSRQWITFKYGTLAFIFEAGYGKVNNGPRKDEWITDRDHRDVGRAVARTLVRYFGLGGAEPEAGWRVTGKETPEPVLEHAQ